jgi:peptidoglycan/xylan/chitin deacetylase (PgdA/CDA1 family)
MRHIRNRYHPVSLAQVQEAFTRGRPLPARAVHVTVDDAYRDFAEHAWPILREFAIPVTVFVPTAYPSEPARTLWWDQLHRVTVRDNGAAWKRAARSALTVLNGDGPGSGEHESFMRAWLRALPHDGAAHFLESTCRSAGLDAGSEARTQSAVLTWDELRALARDGVSFGAHTRHHAALARINEDRVRDEIRGSLQDLNRELGSGAWPIAYPYGIYDRTVMRIAREEGCTLGFTCDDGLNVLGRTRPFQLRRTNITQRTTPSVFAIRMLPWFAEVDRWRHRRERARSSR